MRYVVQPGDTLFLISVRFNTTVNDILAANPQIVDPNVIFVGQVIFIPSGTAIPPETQCPYLLLGDRGNQVRRLQILLQAALFNPGPIDGIFGPRTHSALINFQRSTGQIEVTGVADLETWTALGAECFVNKGFIRYIVRPGETLTIIAARFNITVNDILRVNPQITNPNLIFAGQVINILL